ncbi:MAG: hypothetical protein KDE27_23995 [Planctomycetes bacterium]|nr:hypothetical protein [Planctomycetota bacterium]
MRLDVVLLPLAATLFALGASSQSFVPVPGTLAPTPWNGSADEGLTAPVALGFGFAAPGGATWTSIVATTNGRVAGAGTLGASDRTIATATMLNGPTTLCPLWADLESATLFVDTGSVPGTAVVTWQGALFYGFTTPFDFQLQLDSNGSFTFVYTDSLKTALVGTDEPALVGFSVGQGAANPGPVDFTDVLPALQVPGDTAYEFFSTLDYDLVPPPGSSSAGILALPTTPGHLLVGNIALSGSALPGRRACTDTPASNNVVVLIVETDPVIGAAFDMRAVDLRTGSSALAIYALGFPLAAPLPLGTFGVPQCNALVDPAAVLVSAFGAQGQVITLLVLPNDPALVGFTGLGLQAFLFDPAAALAVLPTNERIVTIGNY